MDAIDRVLLLRRVYDRARAALGSPVSLTYERHEHIIVVLARCTVCGDARVEVPVAPTIDLVIANALDEEELRIACVHRAEEDEDDLRDRYHAELRTLIDEAVVAHNTVLARLAPIAMSWTLRHEDYTYVELTCRCLGCAGAGHERGCTDALRLEEEAAAGIDMWLETEEKSFLAYLRRLGCPHA